MSDIYKQRSFVIQLFFLAFGSLLLFKAMHIQLIDTSYRDRAQATAIDKNIIYPARGLIYDTNDRLLIKNNAMYDLKVTHNQIDPGMDTLKLCRLLGIDKKTFIKNIDKNWRSRRYSRSVPFVFLSKISAETCARFREHNHDFPGFAIQLRNVRGYPHQNAAHVLGYLNEVNQKQIDAYEGKYQKGDYIGATGLEAYYEDILKGKKGLNLILKDNLGRDVGPYKEGSLDSNAISGLNIKTTIDLELQKYGEKLMQNKTGSIVAIDPKTGGILSIVSAPTYDPNVLTINRNRGKAFNQLQKDTLQPFFDRSVSAKYPPGSIFKTIVALVAMQEGIINPNKFIPCNMGYYYKGRVRKCHSHPPAYGVSTALAHSCNAYFFQTLRDIVDQNGFYNPHEGLNEFNAYLSEFGLGDTLGVDIPNERKGNVPTPEYYDKVYKGTWYSPTIMSIGIGQGEIEMTTLQMANVAAIIANRGHYFTPHLIKEFKDIDKPIPNKYILRKTVSIDQQYFEPVIDGMEKALTVGTAKVAFMKDIKICGKTGTSQNPLGEDHSVFFAFAPKENPQIAIAVYVEHGKWGASYAAPIASLMIEKKLKSSIDPSRKYLEDRMLNANLVDLP